MTLFVIESWLAKVVAEPITAIPRAHALIWLLSAVNDVAVPPEPTNGVTLITAAGGFVGGPVDARPPTRMPKVVFSEGKELVALETFRPTALPLRMQFLTVSPFALVTTVVATARRTTDVKVSSAAAAFVIVRFRFVPALLGLSPLIVTLSAPWSSMTPRP